MVTEMLELLVMTTIGNPWTVVVLQQLFIVYVIVDFIMYVKYSLIHSVYLHLCIYSSEVKSAFTSKSWGGFF